MVTRRAVGTIRAMLKRNAMVAPAANVVDSALIGSGWWAILRIGLQLCDVMSRGVMCGAGVKRMKSLVRQVRIDMIIVYCS